MGRGFCIPHQLPIAYLKKKKKKLCDRQSWKWISQWSNNFSLWSRRCLRRQKNSQQELLRPQSDHPTLALRTTGMEYVLCEEGKSLRKVKTFHIYVHLNSFWLYLLFLFNVCECAVVSNSLWPHVWGCRIVWCILTIRYLVSLLPVSIIHVSDIFLVGFWSWEISFIMWSCRGWGFGFREMVGFPAPTGWHGASQSIYTQ